MKYFQLSVLSTILTLSLSSCSAVTWINQKLGLQDDNIVEEVAEDVIKIETGVNIDLTPDSPENK